MLRGCPEIAVTCANYLPLLSVPSVTRAGRCPAPRRAQRGAECRSIMKRSAPDGATTAAQAAQSCGLDLFTLELPGRGLRFLARPCIPMPPAWSRNWPASCTAPSIALLPTPLRPQPGRAAGLRTGPCQRRRGLEGPLALFLSGVSPPAEKRCQRLPARQGRRRTGCRVARLPGYSGGRPQRSVADADAAASGASGLSRHRSYRYQAHGPLDAALHLFGGREDSLRSAELLGWLHEAGATSPSTCSTGSTFHP